MVFGSVPAYLDPPNWNQQLQQNQQQHQHQHQHQPHQVFQTGGSSTEGATAGRDAHQILPAVPPRPEGGSMASSIRPGSTADRARLAKVTPQPEQALKCPRCDSTNTKFCYFNNYSLSQPRHFCKTCRRYWTRGGALRNVPVGGGCRRNKRSKIGSSKSSTSNSHTRASASGATSSGVGAIITSHIAALPQIPLMTPLHPVSEYGTSTRIGIDYGGIQGAIGQVERYQMGGSSYGGLEQWRVHHHQMQQFPFIAGLEQLTSAPPSTGMYPFDTDGDTVNFGSQANGKATASGPIAQNDSLNLEESQQRLNMPRQYFGISSSNDQYWGGGNGSGPSWSDLPGFNSSSTGNLL